MAVSKINVDRNMNCGLPSGRLLNTSKPGTAPVSIAVFLRPAFKGVLGWRGNIKNTSRSLVCAVFNIPALVLNPLNRRQITMLTPLVHPHDRLHHVKIKIEFLATLLNIVNEDDRINFDHPGNANGLYYTLTGFAEEISTAITALEKCEVAA